MRAILDRIRRHWGRALTLGASLALFGVSADALPVAVSLAVVPPTPATLSPGSPLFVEVSVSGLTAGDAPSMMSIDLDISFDEGQLDFVEVVFLEFPTGLGITNGSGEPCTFENLDGNCHVLLDSGSSPGVVDLAAASLLAPLDVNAWQPASGPIAQVEFLVQAGAGSGLLGFDQVVVSGTTVGTTQGVLPSTGSGTSFSVTPEPGTALLLGLGLLGVAARREN